MIINEVSRLVCDGDASLRSAVCAIWTHPAAVRVVNMASDDENEEDFVAYGTPLEPLEEGIIFV